MLLPSVFFLLALRNTLRMYGPQGILMYLLPTLPSTPPIHARVFMHSLSSLLLPLHSISGNGERRDGGRFS